MRKEVLVILVFRYCIGMSYGSPRVHPDFGLDVRQLVDKYGYPFENHTIQTSDGYILQIHRIPYGRNKVAYDGGAPVLIFPGTLSNSADYVNMGRERSLGFLLADQGYDVWLANYRGTRWSRKHVEFDPDVDKKEFWNFSFPEIALYDVTGCIDYILNVTNQEKLFYIGHSQGTAVFFALMSEKPEHNEKIRLMIGLGPAAYFGNTRSIIIHLIAAYKDVIQAFIRDNQLYEVFPYTPWFGTLAQAFCNDYSPFQNICASVFFLAAGYSPAQFNKTMIPVIAANTPAGASAKQWLHYSQVYVSDRIQKYDYGVEDNLKLYGSPQPPHYNLSQITAPVALYLGDKDSFCAKEDVDRTASDMQNVVAYKYIPGFNHLDVIWGNDVVEEVFNDFIELMKRY